MSQRTKVIRRNRPLQTSNGGAPQTPRPANRNRRNWQPGNLQGPALFLLALALAAFISWLVRQ